MLKFLVLFSSVAGRFGNRGQCDYTAANEVLNKLAAYLDKRWPGRVLSVNWGPWEGSGMASAEVQRQFAERGVALISPSAGRRSLDLEIQKGQKGEVEVVIGDGPWRAEAVSAPVPAESNELLPLLHNITIAHQSESSLEVVKCLDPAYDLYLQDHRLDGKPVLPAAMAVELMAEVAQQAWPQMNVTSVEDVCVLKGIVLDKGPAHVRVLAQTNGEIDSKHHTVEAEITITDVKRPEWPLYRAKVGLQKDLPAPTEHPTPEDGSLSAATISAEEAYRKWLFHGPRFQSIRRIEAMDEQGILATLEPSSPADCLQGEPRGRWLIDPSVLDAGPQLAIIWARVYRDITPLPSKFKAVRRLTTDHVSDSIRCYFQVLEGSENHSVFANVFFLDDDKRVFGIIEGLEATGSKALNRLAGAHS
jgi:hypothetical protein